MTPPPEAREPFRAGARFQDRYEILSEIGAGGFGRVYRARQLSTAQDVALKTIRVREEDSPAELENQRERFRREMRLCAALSHPHIVRLIDSGEFGEGLLYAVFEYVPGTTLRQVLEAEGRLELGEALSLMMQVLDAVACAHGQGVVHRDLKPENIMVTRTGLRPNATVLDFGLGGFSARALPADAARLTGSRELLGTPSYAAPEQLRGEPPSPRSDLYSWGLILLECLTGEVVMSGRTAHEALMKQLGPEPVPIPAWLRTQPVGRLLATVTAKEPAARGTSERALLEALESIQRSTARIPSAEERPPAVAEGERQGTAVFTRRVCAVLLADVSGFSALMGEDDERTARAVQNLHGLVRGIVAETQGHAEPVAGDALLATFDSVVAAVDAALQIQRRLAVEEFDGRRLQLRIGVHYGDLLLREGNAFGDAINIAARLQALARPGTICISDGVHRHVHNRFDEQFIDLGRKQLKNISQPVHAYLIVPREAEQRRRGPRITWWVGGAAALAALAVVAVVVIRHQMPAGRTVASPVPVTPAADASGRLVLGVMFFKPLGDPGENAWMREALRDGLNTQLADLSRVKVYSKEFLDFLITRQGLTDIEAATRLGIRKMLSGSVAVDQGRLRIETHVVDVETGVLESSYTTTGRTADFTQLQDEMVQEVISRLNLPVTPEEQRMLTARRNTNMEALRLLLEAESGGAPPPREPRAPDSALPRWLALLEPLGPAPARADAPPAARQEILAALERYRRATEARELSALAAVYVDFPPEQRAAQQRYFENVRDLKVAIENVDIAVVGEEAVVSYTRTDDFADVRTGRPMHVSVRLTKVLRRQDGSWKITGGK